MIAIVWIVIFLIKKITIVKAICGFTTNTINTIGIIKTSEHIAIV
jgi:hypothetical protein